MKIAVIGTGISGLAAAWLLSQRHDVTLYEQNARTGGHTNTVITPSGQWVDTGFIVYNEHNYPNLTQLFRHFAVATQASDMSFGVSIAVDGRDDPIEYAGDSLGTLFAQRRNLLSATHWGMLMQILRFNAQTKKLLRDDALPQISLGDFLQRHGYGAALSARYLLPMAGAIWSCSPQQAQAFPYPEFARFFESHGLLNAVNRPQWRMVCGGSHSYVDSILTRFKGELRSACAVRALRRDDDGVTVSSADGEIRFDAVVSAVHSDQALALLQDADTRERELLGAIPYAPNRAYLHSDIKLLPRRRAAWSSWNYMGRRDAVDDAPVPVSYWMNRLQNLPGDVPYIVTLNPPRPPDPSTVMYETVYDHPQFSGAGMAAQRSLHEIQGRRGVWFCGAWTGYGFHEDGLKSGLGVAAALGCPPPWPIAQPVQHGDGMRAAAVAVAGA